jgi:hypothetical protein
MLNLRPKTTFVIQTEEWTNEDYDDLQMLLEHPKADVLRKLLQRRIAARTEDLLNGKETRDRIDEIKDLILELNNHADS